MLLQIDDLLFTQGPQHAINMCYSQPEVTSNVDLRLTSCRNGCGRVAFSFWEATKLCRPMPAAGCSLLQNWGSIGGRHDAVL